MPVMRHPSAFSRNQCCQSKPWPLRGTRAAGRRKPAALVLYPGGQVRAQRGQTALWAEPSLEPGPPTPVSPALPWPGVGEWRVQHGTLLGTHWDSSVWPAGPAILAGDTEAMWLGRPPKVGSLVRVSKQRLLLDRHPLAVLAGGGDATAPLGTGDARRAEHWGGVPWDRGLRSWGLIGTAVSARALRGQCSRCLHFSSLLCKRMG